MGTLIFVCIFLSLIWLLIVFVRRNDQPIAQPYRSRLTEGMDIQDCETCDRNGTLRLNAPWRKLLPTELMTYANQIDCDCCQSRGVHWIPYGGKFRCKSYANPTYGTGRDQERDRIDDRKTL
jgi:hypothetical protein